MRSSHCSRKGGNLVPERSEETPLGVSERARKHIWRKGTILSHNPFLLGCTCCTEGRLLATVQQTWHRTASPVKKPHTASRCTIQGGLLNLSGPQQSNLLQGGCKYRPFLGLFGELQDILPNRYLLNDRMHLLRQQ